MRETTIRRLVTDHPMTAFVVLAYAISWVTVPLLGGPIGVGPFLAAVIVLAVREGRSGVKGLLGQMAHWRVGAGWYAFALLLPIGAALAAVVLTVALGAESPSSEMVGNWVEIPFNFLLFLLIPLQGPWEEPGFRGFALSHLTKAQSVAVAASVIGMIHVFWHTPLFFTGDIPLSDIVWIVAASFVFAHLVIGSGGSVLLAMMMHAANNAVSGEYASFLFTGSDAELQGWVRATLWCVIAAVVVLVNGRAFTERPALGALEAEPASP